MARRDDFAIPRDVADGFRAIRIPERNDPNFGWISVPDDRDIEVIPMPGDRDSEFQGQIMSAAKVAEAKSVSGPSMMADDFRVGRPGRVYPIPQWELRSIEMYRKVMRMLRIINASRVSKFKLIDIVSGTRQYFNGIVENLVLKLRESRGFSVGYYNLYIYTRTGSSSITAIKLTPMRRI